MQLAALIAAGGRGNRMGSSTPKALLPLAGYRLVTWAVASMAALPEVATIIVAAPADAVDEVAASIPVTEAPVTVVAGGVLRQDTVQVMLEALPDDISHVLVHDAARCLAPAAIAQRVIAQLRGGAQAVIPVVPVVDTVALVDAEGNFRGNVAREQLRLVQTPQGFARRFLSQAHSELSARAEYTDDASLVAELGVAVHTVSGDAAALKITTPADLVIAETLTAESGHVPKVRQ